MLDLNGIVTNWNAGAQRIKGYTAAEIIGQHFSRFYTESDRAAGVPTRALQTAATKGRFEADAWRVRKDGSMFWANVVIDPIRIKTARCWASRRSRAISPSASSPEGNAEGPDETRPDPENGGARATDRRRGA